MAIAAFDTLTVSKDLQQAGLEERHAEAIALAVKQGQGDLATKQDIALLKSDIDHLRTELKSDNDKLRTGLKSDFLWMKWVVGVNIALSVGIATVISGVIALMPSP